MIQTSGGSPHVCIPIECRQAALREAQTHEHEASTVPLLKDFDHARNTSVPAPSNARFGDNCSMAEIEAGMEVMLRDVMSRQFAANALHSKDSLNNSKVEDAGSGASHSLTAPGASLQSLSPPTDALAPAEPSEPAAVATPTRYPTLLGITVVATHVANLASQLLSCLSPYIAPDLFARWANVMVCELVRPGKPRVTRAASCKVLLVGNAVFTPGMMVAPYFAVLALGDLVCWGKEFRNPGSQPFQGDSLANLIAWINSRGGFAKVLDVLGQGPHESTGDDSPVKGSLPKRAVSGLFDKLRNTLAHHDDPAWQKAVASQIRQASAAAFVILIARLPFSDDTASLPAGLLDFYTWLEKAGAATKLAAASAESLVKSGQAEASGGDDVDAGNGDEIDPAALQSVHVVAPDLPDQ
ncbi:hypothetical protein [Pandoraea oxalativorans]|uniref:Uncharacterized protein n=1 Tax=Pandoraea oxalativorans TaxID=573737 RepID=A0A0E3U7K5_9BURK|nr:hypothetical protein [Pandoraea oxalativorans]AKC70508.1 hypothetical protein MB84_14960 [Pandoraea oxalativorans]